jgi:hypothetical protein
MMPLQSIENQNGQPILLPGRVNTLMALSRLTKYLETVLERHLVLLTLFDLGH